MKFRCGRFLIAVALVGCALLASRGAADANSEICPAEVVDSHAFPVDARGGLYSLVLESASEQTARGTVVVSTNAGYFTFAFPDTKFVLDRGEFSTASVTFARNRYLTGPLYVRFPAGVAAISKWWITKAQTTGEKVFGWDGYGPVTCSLAPMTKPKHADENKTEVRVNALPYDLAMRPPSGATVALANSTVAPGDTSCAAPFVDALATDAASPIFPPSVAEMGNLAAPMVTTVVKVFIDGTGALTDTMIYQPSGNAAIDGAAQRAAVLSKYSAAISFCKPVPSSYLFRADFAEAGN